MQVNSKAPTPRRSAAGRDARDCPLQRLVGQFPRPALPGPRKCPALGRQPKTASPGLSATRSKPPRPEQPGHFRLRRNSAGVEPSGWCGWQRPRLTEQVLALHQNRRRPVSRAIIRSFQGSYVDDRECGIKLKRPDGLYQSCLEKWAVGATQPRQKSDVHCCCLPFRFYCATSSAVPSCSLSG